MSLTLAVTDNSKFSGQTLWQGRAQSLSLSTQAPHHSFTIPSECLPSNTGGAEDPAQFIHFAYYTLWVMCLIHREWWIFGSALMLEA